MGGTTRPRPSGHLTSRSRQFGADRCVLREQHPGQIEGKEPRAGRRAVGSPHAGKAAPMTGSQKWAKKYLIGLIR